MNAEQPAGRPQRGPARFRGWVAVALPAVVAAVLVVGAARILAPGPPDLQGELAHPSAPVPSAPDGSPLVGNGVRPETQAELERLTEILAADPQDTNAYTELGYIYLQRARETADPADYTRAETAFGEALRRDPDGVRALTGQASIALARHDFRRALALADRVLASMPDFGPALGARADALTELGRYDEALKAVQTMVDLRPDLASYSRVSYQRELHGDVVGALDVMKSAFETRLGTVENREYIRVLIGDLSLLQGDTAIATQVYEASLETYPGFIWALNGMARVAAAHGDLGAAIGYMEQAVARVPLPEFVITLAELRLANGEDASRDLRLVREIEGLFAANGVNTDLELAVFEANHGDATRALELATAAYAAQPNVKAADALAWALYKNGRLADAQARAAEAIRLDTPRGLFYFHAGTIAAAMGEDRTAVELLERAFAVEPHFSPLYETDALQLLRDLGAEVTRPSRAAPSIPG